MLKKVSLTMGLMFKYFNLILLLIFSLQDLHSEGKLKWILTSANQPPQSQMEMFSYGDVNKKIGALKVVKNPHGGSEFQILGVRNISDYVKGHGRMWYLVDYHEQNIYPFWTKDIEPFESLRKKNTIKYKKKAMKLKKFGIAIQDLSGFWLSGNELGEWRKPTDTGLAFATLSLPSADERIYISVESNCLFLWSYQTDGITDYLATDFKVLDENKFQIEFNNHVKAIFEIVEPNRMEILVTGVKRGNFSREYYRISDKDGFVPPDFYKDHIDLKKVKPRKLKQ